MSLQRSVLPNTGFFNPIKVFPEILLPLVSLFSARFIYPISGDYIASLGFGNAFIYSSVILFCALCLHLYLKYIKDFFSQGRINDDILVLCILTIFFLCLFYFCRNGYYLLWEKDVTCIYHYSIPAILNFSVVLLLSRFEIRDRQIFCFDNIYLNVIWGIVIYLCVFSNLFISSVLLAYVVLVVIKRINWRTLLHLKIGEIFPHNYQYIFFVFIWCISAYMESQGQRASLETENNLTMPRIVESFLFWSSETLHSVAFGKFSFVGVSLVILANTFLLFRVVFKRISSLDRNFLRIELTLLWFVFFIVLYHILLTVKTGFLYQCRPSMIFCWFVWVLLVCITCFLYLSQYFFRVNAIVPIVLLVLLFRLCIHEPPFNEISYAPSSCYSQVKLFGNNLIKKFELADASGGDVRVPLYVPKFDSQDNFPLAVYAGYAIADTLYKHGITKRLLYIHVVPVENSSFCSFLSECQL